MKVDEADREVGVIVGRFQVPELHEAHRDLIQTVVDAHPKVLIVLGLSPVLGTRENPLDFVARKQMILESFPSVTCMFIKDVNSDAIWSKQLDRIISDFLTPNQQALLYGSRDSFIEHYEGKYPTQVLKQRVWVSGTAIRREVSREVKATSDFRRGVVWAAYNRFPTSFTTVDVAIFNEDESQLLLGRKEYENRFRFIGGFSEVDSVSYEQDARREVSEETGISITDPVYIASIKVDDWRYRREVDKIKTLLFVAKHQFGEPRPGDDIYELRWFPIAQLDPRAATLDDYELMPVHWPLMDAVWRYAKQ